MSLERAQGCLAGQLAGDALGSLVEFQSPEEIRCRYPDGVRNLANGGTWNTLVGQPTDDSEMALLLARMLAERGEYSSEAALDAYRFWLDSSPFDVGNTVSSALRGMFNNESQANGALMRVSPLGIFGAFRDLEQLARWAWEDAALTHISPICGQANVLYVVALAKAIRRGIEPEDLYREALSSAREMKAEPKLLAVMEAAAERPPEEYVRSQGWVLIALQNAFWQLLHAPNFEEGVVDTVMRGGDTDTNAAICGALLGVVYGIKEVPHRWVECLENCRPREGDPKVYRPRPECFWPVDFKDLARRLVEA